MPGSPRRFRLPGPFVWSGLDLHGESEASVSADWTLLVSRRKFGWEASAHHKHIRPIELVAAFQTMENAKEMIEAEVARVAASMMVEVEPEEG